MKTYNSYYGNPSASPYVYGDIQRVTNVTDTDTLNYCLELINDSIRYLTQTYYLNERTYQTTTVAKQQFYNLPYNVKELIDVTVNINGVLWIPDFAGNRRYWDALNVITFYMDYPVFFYVYNGQMGLWPIPATTGNVITMNYKERIRDLDTADYSTGTVTATQGKLGQFTATANSSTLTGNAINGTPIPVANDACTLTAGTSLPTGFTAGTTYYFYNVSGTASSFTFQLTTVSGNPAGIVTPTSAGAGNLTYDVAGNVITGSGTSWYQDMAGRWLRITPSATNSTCGDGQWYQIASVQSSTQLTLMNDYVGTGTVSSITGASYVIGQVPLLNEDYQDLPIYRMAVIYYTVRHPDEARAKWFQKLYDDGFERLNKEFGSKTTSPVLLDSDAAIYNPNLFLNNQSGTYVGQ